MRRFLFALAVLVMVVIAAAAFFRLWLAGGEGQAWLKGELSRRTGWKVDFARLSGPLPWGADLDRPALASPDGAIHASAARAELRWSLSSLIDRRPDVRVRLTRPRVVTKGQPRLRQFAARLPRGGHLDVTIVNQGRVIAGWDEDDLWLDGGLRVGRGRVTLRGRGVPREHRGTLRVAFRDLEPSLLPARDHMILSGIARVNVRGRAARFTVDGRYRHRRIEAQVPGATRELPSLGTVRAEGTLRLRPRLDASFVARVRDRGEAARLLHGPPGEVVMRGRYRNRLIMHTEAR